MAKPKLRNLPDLSDLTDAGAEIAVKVTPKAASDRITRDGSVVRIHVTTAPEDGKANEAVRRILATAMGVATSSLTLKRGHTARDKVFVYDP